MLHSFLIGLVAGMRSMTPLALVSHAARRDALPRDHGGPQFLSDPRVALGTAAMAVAELAGDKLPFAPDRIVTAGMAARVVTGAVSGAALAPGSARGAAALMGVAGAVGAAYVTFDVRMRAMRRYGQFRTGVVEDAIVLAAAAWIVAGASRRRDDFAAD